MTPSVATLASGTPSRTAPRPRTRSSVG
jgi:hypothetical protein